MSPEAVDSIIELINCIGPAYAVITTELGEKDYVGTHVLEFL